MVSIGELFVKLGFEVDDKKLKSFDDSLKDVLGTAMKVAGVTGGFGGFTVMLNSAADTATQIRALNSELGINKQYAEGFAAAYSEANPLKNFQDGLAVVSNIQKYITQMKLGQGGNELGFFGGSAADDTPEKVHRRIQSTIKDLTALWGPDVVAQRVAAITGTADAVNLFNQSMEDYQKHAASGVVADADITKLDRYNRALSGLENQLTQLKLAVFTFPAEKLTQILSGEGKDTSKYKSAGDYIKQEGWGSFLWESFIRGSKTIGDGLLDTGALATVGVEEIFGGKGASDEMKAYLLRKYGLAGNKPVAGGPVTLGMANNNPGNLQPGGVEATFRTPEEGLLAMANNLRRYGAKGWDNIDSIVEHWAPASGKGNSAASEAAYKAALMKATGLGGHDRLNLNDPATLARVMAPMIKQEQGQNPYTDSQIKDAALRSVTLNNTYNIQSTGSPKEVAQEVVSLQQTQIDRAFSQTNNGASW